MDGSGGQGQSAGELYHVPGIEGKPAIGVCVAGGGGGGSIDCALSLEKAISRCGFEVVDIIPVRRQTMDIKQRVLTETGKWLADQVSMNVSLSPAVPGRIGA
jgi:hypothetical protein